MSSDPHSQLRELLLTPPPRHVRADLVRAISARNRGISMVVLIGVFLFVAALSVAFFPYGFWRDWQMAFGNVEKTPGKILGAESTKMKINNRRVVRFTFEYQDPRSPQKLTSHCYASGTRWKPGDSATIEYLRSRPDISRIQGARQSIPGTAGLLFVLVPAGIFVYLIILRQRPRRIVGLLEKGEYGEADVTAIERTNVSINRQPVFRITLARQDSLSSAEIVARFHQRPILDYFEEHLSTKTPVAFLADPANPKKVIFPDTLLLG